MDAVNNIIISGSADYTCVVWLLTYNSTDGTILNIRSQLTYAGHSSPITSVIALNAYFAASTAQNNTQLHMWSVYNASVAPTIQPMTSVPVSMTLLPSGSAIIPTFAISYTTASSIEFWSSSCAVPANRYITSQCQFVGNITSKSCTGFTATVGKYVVQKCNAGSSSTGILGSDTVVGNCLLYPPPGWYVSRKCVPGSTTVTGSNTTIAPCTQASAGVEMLAPCIPGAHNVTGADAIFRCTAGSYCSNNTAITCPAGFYCPGNTALAYACAVGSYCPLGSSFPLPCPPGFVCASPTIAVPCAPGSYCPGNTVVETDCPVSMFCVVPNVNTSCIPILGAYCPPRTIFPSLCPPGYYCSDTTVNATCTPGSYCPAGSTAPQPCMKGSYCPDPSISIVCRAPSYCPFNSTSPVQCPAGYYCPIPDTISICKAPQFCPSNSTSMQSCPSSLQETLSDGSSIVEDCVCKAGLYMDHYGVCQPCMPGMVCNNAAVSFTKIKVFNGYFLINNTGLSLNVALCAPGACVNSSCNGAGGYASNSFLCSSCISGYYLSTSTLQASQCSKCDALSPWLSVLGVAVLGLLILSLLVYSKLVSRGKIMQHHQQGRYSTASTSPTAADNNHTSKTFHLVGLRKIRETSSGSKSTDSRGTSGKYPSAATTGILKSNNHRNAAMSVSSTSGNISTAVLPDSVRSAQNISIIQRLILNHLQVLSIVGNFSFNWPSPVQSLYSLSTSISSLGSLTTVGSIRCLFDSLAVPPPMQDMVLVVVAYISAVVLILCFWLSRMKLKPLILRRPVSSTATTLEKIMISVIVLTFLMYSSILRTFFALFACVTYTGDGQSRLSGSLETICYSASHMNWIIGLGLPTFFVLIVGLPFLACLRVYREHRLNKLTDPDNISTIGFLYDGYVPTYWYWECVNTMRKVALSVVLVFFPDNIYAEYNIFEQGLAATIVFLFALQLQSNCRPYVNDDLNRLETYGLLVATLSLCLGLWNYSHHISLSTVTTVVESGGNSGVAQIVTTVAVFGVNSVWVLMVIYHLIAA